VLAGHVDERYELLRKRFSKHESLYFLFNYSLQGFLLIFTSSSLYFTFNSHRDVGKTLIFDEITFYAGVALALRGVYLEKVADSQLEEWKAAKRLGIEKKAESNDPAEQKQEALRKKFHRNCIDGLWSLCRHPNLYYELEFWFGLGLSSISVLKP